MTDWGRAYLVDRKRKEAMAEAKRYEDWAMEKCPRTGSHTNWEDAIESVRIFTEISTCHDPEELDLIIANLKERCLPYFAEKMKENL